MKFYAVGDDKSMVDVTEVVLSLAGGNMSGNIGFKGSKATTSMIRFLDNTKSTYGNGISIGGGGLTIIGGGESAPELDLGIGTEPDVEQLVLASDTTIEFYTNVQQGTIPNGGGITGGCTKVTLDRNGMLSGHQKAISSGTAAPSGGSNGDIYIQY